MMDKQPMVERLIPCAAAAVMVLLAVSAVAPRAGGQDVLIPPPDGFERPVVEPAIPLADLLVGWTLGVSTSIYYDSNVQRSPGPPIAPVVDDWVLSLTPTVGYRTPGGEWFFAASGAFGWNQYASISPSNGYNVGTNFQLGFDGPKLDATLNLSYGFNEGFNRYYDNRFIQQQTLGLGLSAAYRLSAKTSLTGGLRSGGLIPSGADTSETGSYGADLGVRWRATPLVNLDAGLSYSLQSGDRQADRRGFGPYLGGSYRLATKVNLNGRVGLDFVEYSSAGSDQSLYGSLGLDYRVSALWGMNLSLVQGEYADGSAAGGYRETFAVRVGVDRRIRRATVGLGVSYETTQYTGGNTARARGASNYFTLDSSVSMPVFANRASASFYIRYNQEDGSIATETWDGYQIGISLGAGF